MNNSVDEDELRRFSLHIVLVEPEIHFNTGNVGRTCLATGAKLHLVKPLGFSLDDAQVKRAGLDYWASVKPRIWNSFAEIEQVLPQLGSPAFFSAEATRSYWDGSYVAPTVLVFGRESTGLSRAIRDRYRASLFSLPQQPGSVRSLNLSNTVAVAAYEVLRQRRGGTKQCSPIAEETGAAASTETDLGPSGPQDPH